MAAKKRVLVVDDQPGILDLLAEVLLSSGYEVERAMDGQEATVALSQGRFDLVVSDLHMPQWSGFDLLHWMKANERMEKVVVMTGSTEHHDLLEGKFYPVEGILRKPFRIPAFLETVEALLCEDGIGMGRQMNRARRGAA
jgi:CheY-like chemotaxis protein